MTLCTRYLLLYLCIIHSSLQNIMRNLVRRYVTEEQRKADNQGVTEDDVNEIKQDISSFRYELTEILKNSGFNTSASKGQTQSKAIGSFLPSFFSAIHNALFSVS